MSMMHVVAVIGLSGSGLVLTAEHKGNTNRIKLSYVQNSLRNDSASVWSVLSVLVAQDFSYAAMTSVVSLPISKRQIGRPFLSRLPIQCVYCSLVSALFSYGEEEADHAPRLVKVRDVNSLIQLNEVILVSPLPCLAILCHGVLCIVLSGSKEAPTSNR